MTRLLTLGVVLLVGWALWELAGGNDLPVVLLTIAYIALSARDGAIRNP